MHELLKSDGSLQQYQEDTWILDYPKIMGIAQAETWKPKKKEFCSRFSVELVFLDHAKWIFASGRKEQIQKAVRFLDEMWIFFDCIN
jgi:hypothetical protein